MTQQISRRRVAAGMAWSVPAVAAVSAMPAFAASPNCARLEEAACWSCGDNYTLVVTSANQSTVGIQTSQILRVPPNTERSTMFCMQFRLTKPVGATISSPVSNGHFATSGTSTWGSWVLSTDPTGWQSTTLNRAAGLTPQASESMLYTLCLTVSSPSTYGYCICGGFNFTQIGLAATEVAAYEIVGLTVTLPSGTTTCASAQQTKKVFTNDLKVTTNNPNVQYYGANSAPTSSCAGTKWGSGYPPAGCSV